MFINFKPASSFYVLGYIRDQSNRPVPRAVIQIIGKNITEIADENGKYGVPLPVGNYTVKVIAQGYFSYVTSVAITRFNEEIPVVFMVDLKKDTSFWGIPRLVFVLLTGEILFLFSLLNSKLYVNEYSVTIQRAQPFLRCL